MSRQDESLFGPDTGAHPDMVFNPVDMEFPLAISKDPGKEGQATWLKAPRSRTRTRPPKAFRCRQMTGNTRSSSSTTPRVRSSAQCSTTDAPV